MSLELTSPAFDADETIPTKYTCEGKNISPPLTWRGIPEGTKSLALVFDDPDASQGPSSPFSHWVLYNLPPDLDGLPEGFSSKNNSSHIGTNGSNSYENRYYEGPCPPKGRNHHYVFRLFALENVPEIEPGVHRAIFLEAISEQVLEETEYVGFYEAGG